MILTMCCSDVFYLLDFDTTSEEKLVDLIVQVQSRLPGFNSDFVKSWNSWNLTEAISFNPISRPVIN